MKASASFPVAFPATTLACDNPDDQLNPYLHVMDGGLADNSGYRTALEFLRQDNASRKVLLIIDAYKGITQPYSAKETSPAGLDVAYRTMKISLDGERNRLLDNVQRLAGEDGGAPIEVILLSFADLRPLLMQRIDDTRKALQQRRREARAGHGPASTARALECAPAGAAQSR